MKTIWQRLRVWWWGWVCGFPREATLDLMDGIDQGDRPVLSIRLYLVLRRRRKLLTAEDLERLDAELRAGGPVQDEVIRRIGGDLRGAADEGRRIAGRYLARRN